MNYIVNTNRGIVVLLWRTTNLSSFNWTLPTPVILEADFKQVLFADQLEAIPPFCEFLDSWSYTPINLYCHVKAAMVLVMLAYVNEVKVS